MTTMMIMATITTRDNYDGLSLVLINDCIVENMVITMTIIMVIINITSITSDSQ